MFQNFDIFNISQLKWLRFNILAIIFLSILTSTLSIFGSIGLFSLLHNSIYVGILVGISFEIGQILSLITYGTLAKQNKDLILGLIILLTGIQIVANINTSWYYIHNALNDINLPHFSPTTIKIEGQKAIAIVDFFNWNSENPWKVKDWANRFIVLLMSGSLPVISLMYVKSLINYFSPADSNVITEKTEEITVDVIPEEVEKVDTVEDIEPKQKRKRKPKLHSLFTKNLVINNPNMRISEMESIPETVIEEPIQETVIENEPVENLTQEPITTKKEELITEDATEISNVYEEIDDNLERVRIIESENKTKMITDNKFKIRTF